MPKTFACPNCGAPLDADGITEITIECPYCSTSIIVPEELRSPEPPPVIEEPEVLEAPPPPLVITVTTQTLEPAPTAPAKNARWLVGCLALVIVFSAVLALIPGILAPVAIFFGIQQAESVNRSLTSTQANQPLSTEQAQFYATATQNARLQATSIAQLTAEAQIAQATQTAAAAEQYALATEQSSMATAEASVNATATAIVEATAQAQEALQIYQTLKASASPVISGRSGELAHNVSGNLIISREAGVNLRNFIVEVTFYNPYPITQSVWDFGLLFRTSGPNQAALVAIDSDRTWAAFDTQGSGFTLNLGSGEIANLDVSDNGANTLALVVQDSTGWIFLNGVFIAEIDLSNRTVAGDIEIAAGIYGNLLQGSATRYENFSVWGLP
jgi:DNA-directed RNA polymerase subunit RPC12/RpoP